MWFFIRLGVVGTGLHLFPFPKSGTGWTCSCCGTCSCSCSSGRVGPSHEGIGRFYSLCDVSLHSLIMLSPQRSMPSSFGQCRRLDWSKWGLGETSWLNAFFSSVPGVLMPQLEFHPWLCSWSVLPNTLSFSLESLSTGPSQSVHPPWSSWCYFLCFPKVSPKWADLSVDWSVTSR